jgi:ABC-2 type transport system permease protein
VNLPTVTVNPVLRRELVERMRGSRAAVVLTVYLTLLSGIFYLVYRIVRDTRVDPWESAASQIASAGRGIFEWLVFFMVLLVLFLVPGITSGAIAGERERQTLVPLQVTMLRPVSILLGKVGASTAFLLLLLVATMPLLAVSYLIGGVSIPQVMSAVVMVGYIGLALAAITAGISACVKRVQAATVLAYALTLALVIGTLLLYATANLVDASRGTDEADAPGWILAPNPLAALADVVEGDERGDGIAGTSPFDGLMVLIDRQEDDEGDFVAEGGDVVVARGDAVVVAAGPGAGPAAIGDDDDGLGMVWMTSLLLAVMAAAGVAIGARRLRAPAATER